MDRFGYEYRKIAPQAIEFDYRRESEWAPPMYHFWIMSIIASGKCRSSPSWGRDMLVAIYYLFTGKDLLAQEDLMGIEALTGVLLLC